MNSYQVYLRKQAAKAREARRKEPKKMTAAYPANMEVVKEAALDPKGLKELICKALEPRFCFYDELATMLALTLAGEQNCWVYGPGGYGKSEMVEAAIRGLGLYDETFFQVFGQGTSSDTLLGNVDLKKIKEEDKIEYNTENSFMAKRVAVFEEMPDASLPALFVLKDLMTRGKLYNGNQVAELRTKSIIVASNREPAYMIDYGIDAAALKTRFHLEMKMELPNYKEDTYGQLLDKWQRHMTGPKLNGHTKTYAQLLAGVCDAGELVPPRTARAGLITMSTHAKLHGRSHIEENDMHALKLVSGLSMMGQELVEGFKQAVERQKAEEAWAVAERKALEVMEKSNKAKDGTDVFRWIVTIEQNIATLATMKATDKIEEKRSALMTTLQNQIHEMYKRGRALVA